MSDLDSLRSIHRPVYVAHSSFIEGSHTAKNTACNTKHFTSGFNEEASYVNITLDGCTYHNEKLVQFIIPEKTYNVNKTHHLKTWKGAGIL